MVPDDGLHRSVVAEVLGDEVRGNEKSMAVEDVPVGAPREQGCELSRRELMGVQHPPMSGRRRSVGGTGTGTNPAPQNSNGFARVQVMYVNRRESEWAVPCSCSAGFRS